jgi:predicted DsbA family dithiol-disulfide isomerase
MLIEIYADIVCPWCYIGERRLARALRQRPELQVERRWRPFQLRPEMPATGVPWDAFVRDKFGGAERARQIFQHVTSLGAVEGIRFDFDNIASAPNTADAHRLVLLAAREGKEWEMVDALSAAYFTRGLNLNDEDDLARVATEVGLEAEEVRVFVAGEEEANVVWQSQEEAQRLGITSVPTFVIDHQYALQGAQEPEQILRLLDQVYA